MIGTTRDELRFFRWGAEPRALPEAVLRAIVAHQLPGRAPDGRERCDVVIEAFRGSAARGFEASPQAVFEAIQTALSLRLPALRVAEGHVRRRGTPCTVTR